MILSSRAFRAAAFLAMTVLASGLMSGCATQNAAQFTTGRNSYVSIRKSVVNQLPLGIRKVSENGREYDSGYFMPDVTKFQLDATKEKERATGHVKILGDSRPYQVEVVVRVEVRQNDGRYADDGVDDALSAELSRRIKADLGHRREELNIIDDFRAF